MTPTILLLTAGAALLLSAFAATAAKTFYEFARHDLEELCERKKRERVYGRIIDHREQLALGAETLQIVSLVVFLICGLLWLWEGFSADTLTVSNVVGAVVMISIVVLAANSWLPLAILNVAAAPFLFYTWRFWWFITLLAKPLSVVFGLIIAIFQRATGTEQSDEAEEEAFEDEIRSMVSEAERDGFLEIGERKMIEGVIELDDKDVGEIMTSKQEIVSVEVTTEWPQLLKFVSEHNKTRIPVYQDELNNIIGFLHTKDLLPEFLKPEKQRRTLQELVRESMFVPDSVLIDELLKTFQANRMHMAIVMNEFDSVVGLITIEDILEEIVGEIVDETEPDPEPIFLRIDENTIQTKATTKLEKLNDELKWELPEDLEVDTVGGLMMFELGQVPAHEAILQIAGYELMAIGNRLRSIEKVRVRKMSEEELSGQRSLEESSEANE